MGAAIPARRNHAAIDTNTDFRICRTVNRAKVPVGCSSAAKQEVEKGEISQIGISGKATARALTNASARAKFA